MIQIYALDGLDRVATLDKVISAQFQDKDLAVGSWQVTLPMPESGAGPQYWRTTDNPGVEAVDLDTGWRYYGYVTSILETRTRGVKTLELSGLAIIGDLEARLAWPNPNQALDFWQTTLYGPWEILRASHELVRRNMFDTVETIRRVPNSTLDPFPPSTAMTNQIQAEGDSLLTFIRGLLERTDFTFNVWLDRSTPDDPTIRYTPRVRKVSTDMVYIDRNEAQSVKVHQRASTHNISALMGVQSNPPNDPRYVSIFRYSDTVHSNWKYRPREKFTNRPGTELDVLSQENVAIMRAGRTQTSVEIKGVDIRGYGTELELGDVMRVNLGESYGGEVIETPITSYTVKVSDKGVIHDAQLGKVADGGPAGIYQDLEAVRDALRRLNIKSHRS